MNELNLVKTADLQEELNRRIKIAQEKELKNRKLEADNILKNIDGLLSIFTTHDRTSCNDGNCCNCFMDVNHLPRCTRCVLRAAKHKQYWEPSLKLVLSIERQPGLDSIKPE